MSTFRISSFPEGETPVATLRTRGSDTALTPTYTGVAVSGRPSVYEFDIGARANGDYEIDIAEPRANYVLRVATAGNTVANTWIELETKVSAGNSIQLGETYTWENQAGDTHEVTISEIP